MARREQTLLIGVADEEEKVALCDRLWSVGFRAFPARDAAHAVDLLDREGPFRVAIVASRSAEPTETVAKLRAAAPESGLRIIMLGERIPAASIAAAKDAGASLALWDPFHDSELRFVVNQAAYDQTRGEVRERLRVPTQLGAFVHSGTARKPAGVYNLSLRGAYLETPRPNGSGATVQIELLMREGSVHVNAEVVTTNVPGNLRKANRPIGMGVRFLDLDRNTEEALEKYIEQRANLYHL